MDITEITTLLGSILGVLTPLGGVGIFLYRKQCKRLKESEARLAEANVDKAKVEVKAEDWHIWKEQCEALSEQNRALLERNSELIRINREKEDAHQQDIKDWESRFTDQTRVLRDTQREFRDTLTGQIELTQQIGDLREANAYLRQWLCEDAECDHGKPPRERLKGKRFDRTRLHKCPTCGELKINTTINETK